MAAAAGVHDLLIVGPGVLGSYAGKLWKEAHPDARVIAQTNTTNNHERLRAMGLEPRTRTDAPASARFPYVLFSAPPSGSADYAGDVMEAAGQLWDAAGPGNFVFTSSNSVADAPEGGVVTEDTPNVAPGAGPGTDKLLAAEAAVLAAGGNVVRLVGLYHAHRGAHTFFLKQASVARNPGYLVNLLHYEDAAALAVAVLLGAGNGGAPWRGRVFLGSDNHPVTFEAMMAACMASGLFDGQSVEFTAGPEAGLGKRVDSGRSRALLGGWAPKYTSFEEFMVQGKGQDWYSASGLF